METINNNDYLDLAKKSKSLDVKDIKALNNLITCQTVSGDEEKQDEEGNATNNWNYLVSEKNNETLSYNHDTDENSLEDTTQDNLINTEFHKLRNSFLNTLSEREKEILYHTKFKEFDNLTNFLTLDKLGKKFGISGERVRKISIKKFEEFKNILIKNKKRLGR